MTPTGTEARVCRDIAERQARGIAKYGTTVAENPIGLVQWLQHAYEEALDQAVYLKRAIEVLQGQPQDQSRVDAVTAMRWMTQEARRDLGDDGRQA